LTSRPDKRFSLFVLVKTWSLTDEHNVGIRGSISWNPMLAGMVQNTTGTLANLPGNFIQDFTGCHQKLLQMSASKTM
jgi:hypothetical protein